MANGKTDRIVEVDVMIEEALDLLINIRELSLWKNTRAASE